ncbi:hypothetical protein OsI_09248 [Oryza sativa Indica Group]|uniref:Uncharacterized protein n=1 Tax=Oryza sativa subsp. indica TaxID=39946 RepID=B8AE33_ORYSI|nr:hypothetical protein OsI_09248 [Oryza sativa Indica Group]
MAFPNFTDVAGAVVLLFLADSSPAPSPPPPPPTVRLLKHGGCLRRNGTGGRSDPYVYMGKFTATVAVRNLGT